MKGIFKGIFAVVKKEYISWFTEYVSHDRYVCFNSNGVLYLIVSMDEGLFVGLLKDTAISSMDFWGFSLSCERRKTSMGQLGLFSYVGKRSGLSC